MSTSPILIDDSYQYQKKGKESDKVDPRAAFIGLPEHEHGRPIEPFSDEGDCKTQKQVVSGIAPEPQEKYTRRDR